MRALPAQRADAVGARRDALRAPPGAPVQRAGAHPCMRHTAAAVCSLLSSASGRATLGIRTVLSDGPVPCRLLAAGCCTRRRLLAEPATSPKRPGSSAASSAAVWQRRGSSGQRHRVAAAAAGSGLAMGQEGVCRHAAAAAGAEPAAKEVRGQGTAALCVGCLRPSRRYHAALGTARTAVCRVRSGLHAAYWVHPLAARPAGRAMCMPPTAGATRAGRCTPLSGAVRPALLPGTGLLACFSGL